MIELAELAGMLHVPEVDIINWIWENVDSSDMEVSVDSPFIWLNDFAAEAIIQNFSKEIEL